jgi:hypothetical protein
MEPLSCESADAGVPAIIGEYTGSGDGYGVRGISKNGRGVQALSDTNYAIRAHSKTLSGARISSDEGTGVEGEARGAGTGVGGSSKSGKGIHGFSETGAGVVGESNQFDGVFGVSHDPKHAGVSGHNPGGLAGFFNGNVEVTGNIRVNGDITLANADCAEDFAVSAEASVEPGTVMALDDQGNLRESSRPYDKRVAGVISGAGNYKPGLVLDKQQSRSDRKPVALLGKVCCKADAGYASIEVGDLLTTSETPGYAMKATDPLKAFGAVIGKALRPLKEGQGLIPILIALQ